MNGHMNEIFFCRRHRGLSLRSKDSHEQRQHCPASARFDRVAMAARSDHKHEKLT
jgi:hypothetical protein